jgi:hypothetical protein
MKSSTSSSSSLTLAKKKRTPNTSLIPRALPPTLLTRAKHIFFESEDVQYMSPEESKVHVFGYKNIPRKQCAYSNPPGMHYGFSGSRIKAHPESDLPIISEIRAIVETLATMDSGIPTTFNFVLVNFYRDGKDHIGWHNDNEGDMIQDSIIASLSLGASRDFDLRLIKDHQVKHRVILDDNTLLLMKPPTNSEWHHCVPQRLKLIRPRVNLTFRQFKPQVARKPQHISAIQQQVASEPQE